MTVRQKSNGGGDREALSSLLVEGVEELGLDLSQSQLDKLLDRTIP